MHRIGWLQNILFRNYITPALARSKQCGDRGICAQPFAVVSQAATIIREKLGPIPLMRHGAQCKVMQNQRDSSSELFERSFLIMFTVHSRPNTDSAPMIHLDIGTPTSNDTHSTRPIMVVIAIAATYNERSRPDGNDSCCSSLGDPLSLSILFISSPRTI